MRAVEKAFAELGLDTSHASLAFFEESLRSTAIQEMFASPPPEIMTVYGRLMGASK
jgi:hypothetical protein